MVGKIFKKDTSLNPEQKAEKSRRRRYRWRLILALIIPSFLASTDATIIAPAITLISRDFNRLEGAFSWLATAFTLTNTAFTPVSGQIADLYGRHAALQFCIFWLLIGSVLCAAAQSWGMLLLGRALQGIGSSGIQNLNKIILSDGVSLDENARNNTIFSLVAGFGYGCGPIIGGFLALTGWRYLFVLSVGVAFISHVLVFLLLRGHLRSGSIEPKWKSRVQGLQRFDAFGILQFLFGTGLLILAVSWGGTEYAWKSTAVIVPLIIGGILFLSFFGYEYLMEPGRIISRLLPKQLPLIPAACFRKKDTWLLSIINFATGAALFSPFYFASLYWTQVEGYSSSGAGIQLVYYTPGLGVGVYMAMAFCNWWPARTFGPIFLGSVVEAVGIGLLAYATGARLPNLVRGFMAMAGAGTGLRFMPVGLHASGLWPQERRAAVLSLLSFCVPFGGTIAIAMMGSVFTNNFRSLIDGLVTGQHQKGRISFGTNRQINYSSLSPEVLELVQGAAAKAVRWSFVSLVPFMLMSVIAAFFLGNVWIKEKTSTGQPAKVLEGFYLKAVMQGKVDERTRARDDEVQDDEVKKQTSEMSG